jgi:hypothetical protein
MKFLFTEVGLTHLANGANLDTVLAAGTLHLFSNNVTYDWNRVVADLTDAAYTGYVPINLTAALSGPFQDPVNQNVFYKLPMASFGKCTALPETEYGVYLSDTATGLILFGMAVFDDPEFIAVGSTIFANVLFPIGQGNQLSGVEVDQAA